VLLSGILSGICVEGAQRWQKAVRCGTSCASIRLQVGVSESLIMLRCSYLEETLLKMVGPDYEPKWPIIGVLSSRHRAEVWTGLLTPERISSPHSAPGSAALYRNPCISEHFSLCR
jgi:hypothetical protein